MFFSQIFFCLFTFDLSDRKLDRIKIEFKFLGIILFQNYTILCENFYNKCKIQNVVISFQYFRVIFV